ncbi:hypothetical protein [Streptomyces sp. NPDC048192]
MPGTTSTARPPYARYASSADEARQLSGVRRVPVNRPWPFPNGTSQASGE